MSSGKIAVVGVGGWGKHHVRVFKTLESEGLIEGVIAVDIDVSKLRFMERMFGVEVENDIRRVVVREDVVGLVISTPTPLHYEHAKLCVENGKHVLVEKPLTSTLKEALKLLELSERMNVIVSVGLLLRYHPAVEALKEKIRGGLLGKPLTLRGKRTSWWPKREMDVGVVKDLAIHDIDLAHYLLDEDTVRVYGRVGSLIHPYEDYCIVLTEYKSGVAGSFEANWLTPYKTRILELTGERGIAIIDFVRDTLTLQFEDGIYTPKLQYREPLMVQDEAFIKTIQGGNLLKITLKDAIKALAVCEAVIESDKKRSAVKVEYPV